MVMGTVWFYKYIKQIFGAIVDKTNEDVLYRNVEGKTCSYGCGFLATVTFKNGRHCCSEFFNACPAIKKKNSNKHLGNTHKQGKPGRVGGTPWNKGLTKDTDARVKKASLNSTGKITSEFTRQKLSEAAKKNGLGGYNPKGGRGKKGRYRGIWCDSSWELAFVLYHIDRGSDIEKCREVRSYEYRGEVRNYHPDFVVDGTVYEVKGWKSPQWEAKMASNPDVVVMYKDEMTPILDFVMKKYGKDFVELYE